MYFRASRPSSSPGSAMEAAGARTKNNLRFIEMQRGEPLVILFHRHQRRAALSFALFVFALSPFLSRRRRLDPACLFFSLTICSE